MAIAPDPDKNLARQSASPQHANGSSVQRVLLAESQLRHAEI
jgi:hypothetical protein